MPPRHTLLHWPSQPPVRPKVQRYRPCAGLSPTWIQPRSHWLPPGCALLDTIADHHTEILEQCYRALLPRLTSEALVAEATALATAVADPKREKHAHVRERLFIFTLQRLYASSAHRSDYPEAGDIYLDTLDRGTQQLRHAALGQLADALRPYDKASIAQAARLRTHYDDPDPVVRLLAMDRYVAWAVARAGVPADYTKRLGEAQHTTDREERAMLTRVLQTWIDEFPRQNDRRELAAGAQAVRRQFANPALGGSNRWVLHPPLCGPAADSSAHRNGGPAPTGTACRGHGADTCARGPRCRDRTAITVAMIALSI